jgi:hypothetical protein
VLGHSTSNLGRISWPVALTFVALIVAFLIGFVFYRIETWPTRTTHQGIGEAERIARDLGNVLRLQPRVTSNNRVYLEQTEPKSELAVISRRVEVEHEFIHSWLGSSKRVKLHGTFAVKAGFDLRQGLAVDVRPDEIILEVPHAQLLGVEQDNLDVLAFENGFWNRISAADVQSELSILPQLAREKATESGLPAEAEHALQEQLEQRIHTPQPLHLLFMSASKKD